MPIRFRIRPEIKCVFVKGTGRISLADVLGYIRALGGHPDFRPGMSELIDYSGATAYELTPDDVHRVVAEDTLQQARLQIDQTALIAPKDHIYGMIRMYEMLSDSDSATIRVFRHYADAQRWLGLPELCFSIEESEEEEDE